MVSQTLQSFIFLVNVHQSTSITVIARSDSDEAISRRVQNRLHNVNKRLLHSVRN